MGRTVQRVLYQDEIGTVIQDEPMMFRRLFATGQTLVMHSKSYRVKSVDITDVVQVVTLTPCQICGRCGGIIGEQSIQEGCCCERIGHTPIHL